MERLPLFVMANHLYMFLLSSSVKIVLVFTHVDAETFLLK